MKAVAVPCLLFLAAVCGKRRALERAPSAVHSLVRVFDASSYTSVCTLHLRRFGLPTTSVQLTRAFRII